MYMQKKAKPQQIRIPSVYSRYSLDFQLVHGAPILYKGMAVVQRQSDQKQHLEWRLQERLRRVQLGQHKPN